MIGIVNKAKQDAAKMILNKDYSKAGFFLNEDEINLPVSEKYSIAYDRAKEFLNQNKS